MKVFLRFYNKNTVVKSEHEHVQKNRNFVRYIKIKYAENVINKNFKQCHLEITHEHRIFSRKKPQLYMRRKPYLKFFFYPSGIGKSIQTAFS